MENPLFLDVPSCQTSADKGARAISWTKEQTVRINFSLGKYSSQLRAARKTVVQCDDVLTRKSLSVVKILAFQTPARVLSGLLTRVEFENGSIWPAIWPALVSSLAGSLAPDRDYDRQT